MSGQTPKSSHEDELSHASRLLAEFFEGVVIEDVDEADRAEAIAPTEGKPPLPAPVIPVESVPLFAVSAPLTDSLPDETIEPDQPEQQLLVSLDQLREWYAIARSLQRVDRLQRIAQLGSQFKRLYGDATPSEPHPFTAWSEKEVEWWLADLATYQAQSPHVGQPRLGQPPHVEEQPAPYLRPRSAVQPHT